MYLFMQWCCLRNTFRLCLWQTFIQVRRDGFFGEGDRFISPLSVLSFLHVCVSYTLVHHFLRLPPPPLCPPPALLFSQHACHPRGEGGLLPLGQLREAVFAPSVCPAEQTALLLQCGQSLGPSLRQMPPSRNR